jgi:carboxylesterase
MIYLPGNIDKSRRCVNLHVIPGAEEFYFRGGRIGCLLIHGFAGSPSEMLLLGEYLADRGYTVLGVRLEGHGTSPEDMVCTDRQQWYQSVVQGFQKIRQDCEQVFTIGLSMGGILALYLASEHTTDGVVVLSAPIFLNNYKLPFLPIYRLFRTYEPRPRKALPVDSKYNIAYEKVPLRCVTSLLELINMTKERLCKIKSPVLIVQSKVEHTVKPESAEYIYKNLTGVEDKDLLWLHGSGHVVTLDKQRNVVCEAVEEFLHKHSS